MLTMQFAHFLDDELKADDDGDDEKRAEEVDDEALRGLVGDLREIMGAFNCGNARRSPSASGSSSSSSSLSVAAQRISVGDESLGYWGFNDCRFMLKDDKLAFSGSRYEISDRCFDSIAFMSTVSGIPLLRNRRCHSVRYSSSIGTLSKDHRVFAALNRIFGAESTECISTDIAVRYRHGTGHTISDMMALRIEDHSFRIPDVVVWPQSREHIVALVGECGGDLKCGLIPFGGGTNVTHSLWCDPEEGRVIVSVDMGRMDRIQWVNRENATASIEAGMRGKAMERQLKRYGFTTGHCPDSYEFSTLGGWIATFASGMKRAKYGNIEHIVLDLEVVTARGVISRNVPFGRVAVGSNDLLQFYGSEGLAVYDRTHSLCMFWSDRVTE